MAESYSVYDTINTRIESGDLKGILTLEYITAFPTEDFLGKYVLDDIIPRIIQGYRIACDWETRGFSRPVAMRTITLARFQARYLAYQLQLPIFSIRYEGFCDSSYASKLKAVAKIFDAVNGLPCILYFEGIDRLSPGFKTWMEIAQFGSVLCQELDNLSAKVITVMSYYDPKIAQDIESMLLAMKIYLPARHTRMLTGGIGEPVDKDVAKKMAKAIFHHLGINTGFWFKRWAKCFSGFYKSNSTEMDVIRLCVQEATRHLPNGTGTVGTEGKVVPVPWEEK